MRVKILIPVLIILFMVPIAAWAVDQETIDNYIFLLQQPEWDMWGDGVFDDESLIDGLETIYTQAVADDNEILASSAIWAMGETGLPAFIPTIIAALEDEPVVACYALGKISSEDSVYALIPMLDNEDMQVRDAAVWGLGSMLYTSDMEDASDAATAALQARLDVEEEDWILEDIGAAITLIETGIITDAAFMEDIEEH